MWNAAQSFVRQSWLVLLLAAVLSGSLAGVHSAVSDRISAQAQQRIAQAALEVVPRGADATPVELGGQTVFRVQDQAGQHCGWATLAESMGFQDRIVLMVGLSRDGRQVTGLTVLESHETPGLGDRIQQPAFLQQFWGQGTDQPFVRVKPGETASAPIHAVTGATISSQAVIAAVNKQLAELVEALAAQPPEPQEPSP